MDPLSVTASVVGLLAGAGKVIGVLHKLKSSVGDAPDSFHHLLSQMKDLRICLLATKEFLKGIKAASAARASMIPINELVAILTEAVLTISELEALVIPLGFPSELSMGKRLAWAWNEERISSIMTRLDRHKSSLSYMLNIVQCSTDTEAENSLRLLHDVVGELLLSNQEISRRVQELEVNYDSQSIVTSCCRNKVNGDENTETIQDRKSFAEDCDAIGYSQFGNTLEKALGASRVYKRTLWRESGISLATSAVRTQWSPFSGLSISQVSNMSVIAVPVHTSEIYGLEQYEINMSGLPLPRPATEFLTKVVPRSIAESEIDDQTPGISSTKSLAATFRVSIMERTNAIRRQSRDVSTSSLQDRRPPEAERPPSYLRGTRHLPDGVVSPTMTRDNLDQKSSYSAANFIPGDLNRRRKFANSPLSTTGSESSKKMTSRRVAIPAFPDSVHNNSTNTLFDSLNDKINSCQEGSSSKGSKEIPLISPKFQVVILGKSMVGKTSLAERFSQGYPTPNFGNNTYETKTVVSGQSCTIHVIDLYGDNYFAGYLLANQGLPCKDGFLLVYSITSRASFEGIQDIYWILIKDKYKNWQRRYLWNDAAFCAANPLPIVLVGNKCDEKTLREVSTSEGQALALEWNCRFYESSTKHGIHVESVFQDVVGILQKDGSAGEVEPMTPNQEDNKKLEQQSIQIQWGTPF